MPKNYKTYSSPGSFGRFQTKVPDQTGKIKEETQKQIKGRETAQRFLEQNREIWIRGQRLINSAEEASRDASYDMQSKERQSFKNALDRDYKIRMDNLDRQSAGKQQELKQISAFSQTAFNMVGDYLKEQEQKKIAAAHDVMSRTGMTTDQMFSFQKMNDNLTRSEFAAQDIVQNMLGNETSSEHLDALFTIYQNRATKRWYESKALFSNTTNSYPSFLEEKISEIQKETGQTVTDFDPVLAEAKREFIQEKFVGKARPEVLAGLGIYAKLDEYNTNRRGKFLTVKRDLQKKEFKKDRINAILSELRDNGPIGVANINGTNPSYEKRQAIVDAFKLGAKGTGMFAVTENHINGILDLPGAGSNGKTLRESFPAFAADMTDIIRDIDNQNVKDQDTADKLQKNRVEGLAVQVINELGEDGVLSDADIQTAEKKIHAAYPGYESQELKRARMMTPEASIAKESEQMAENLALFGRYTTEVHSSMKFNNVDRLNYWANVAKVTDLNNKHPDTTAHYANIENFFYGSPRIAGQIAANPKKNEQNYKLAVADYKRRYDSYVAKMFLVKDADMNKVRKDAMQLIQGEIAEEIEKSHNEFGMEKFQVTTPTAQERVGLLDKVKAGKKQLQAIRDIAIADKDLSDDTAFRNAADLMNHQLIQTAMDNYASPNFVMPPAIEVYAEATNRSPLFVLQKIAPFIGDGSLKIKLDNLSGELERKYQEFINTPYTPIRNTYRTVERTGRANIGDQKLGASAPIRPSMFNVVQYVSADPSIKGKDDGPGGRIYYEARQHGGKHYHNHYEFENREQAAAAVSLFKANGFKVTSYLRPEDKDSAHSQGVAIDVAPPVTLPYTDEAEAAWSASANAVIGFNPLENE